MKKLVYIAGPYRSTNGLSIEENIDRARAVAWDLAQNGFYFICPHMNSSYMDQAASDEFWLEMGKALLEKCDAMTLVPGWEKSEGTKLEIEHAREKDIPIFEGDLCSRECPYLIDATNVFYIRQSSLVCLYYLLKSPDEYGERSRLLYQARDESDPQRKWKRAKRCKKCLETEK